MNRVIDIILSNPWIDIVLRLLLGGIFIFAGTQKMMNPAAFAKIIYGYQLFPGDTINLIAIGVPFIEVVAGIALVAGIWPRASAIIIGGMLMLFIIAISINLIRGHEFDCGCFSVGRKSESLSAEQLLIRDCIWFCCAAVVVMFNGKRKFCILKNGAANV